MFVNWGLIILWNLMKVRVYTADKVEEELEAAKREYLEASVGISRTKMGIPKLMEWYSHDFAKDTESLLDWICLQLPTELGKDALNCLQQGMSQSPASTRIHIIPYEFSFRYLFSIWKCFFQNDFLFLTPSKKFQISTFLLAVVQIVISFTAVYV